MPSPFTILHSLFTNPEFLAVFHWIFVTSPIWLTFILAVTGWNMWLTYRRTQFILSQNYVVLEIKIPKDVFKSPIAMEFLFNALYQTFGEDHLKIKLDRWPIKIANDYYWKGSVRPWFSFEICAIDGKLHFYIWCRTGSRSVIEAQLYSQYPGIEIYEVPDYTLPVEYDPEKIGMWASELVLTKADAFPIKTYVDYGMDRDPKEEYKIDPILPLTEFLGSLPAGHQVWIQIVITAHKATDYDKATGKMVDLKWAKGAEEEIQKILDKAKPPKPKEGEQAATAPRSLTEGEKDTISALERSVGKRGFDTGIRAIYFAPKDIFNVGNVGGIMGGMSHFNSGMNGFKGGDPLMDVDRRKRQSLYAYKNRGYFWNEFRSKNVFVLNTEELATIYHFPGGITETPGLDHISSRKSQAPSNLPI